MQVGGAPGPLGWLARAPPTLSAIAPPRTSTTEPRVPPAGKGTIDVIYPSPGGESVVSYNNIGSPPLVLPNANHSFVQSLYHNALGRSGTQAELAGWVKELPAIGQAGVAAGVNHLP